MDTIEQHLDAGSPVGSLVWTSLMYACAKGDVALVDDCLNANNSLHDKGITKFNYTALHVAVKFDQKDFVKKLLAQGAVIDAIDEMGFTSLHFAAALGLTNMVELLLQANAKQLPSKTGIFPHECALEAGHIAIAERLQPHIEPVKENLVHKWLKMLGFNEYIALFDGAGYDDLEFIRQEGLSREDLKAIGVEKHGHILKLSRLYQIAMILGEKDEEKSSEEEDSEPSNDESDSEEESEEEE
ncbi:hypothetical protein THRCLA_02508 [Thraustotheca clavata]|uniref:SAM domain-containing protein n=1 Tax=Thraustotheca clavata TaxID=74557 RepID=A0A1W0A539_9STRA|nr:hypothetical protein THRCLA_02508 [Thraustotheca clavata]